MKKRYIILAAWAFSAGLFAQTQDSLLRRQLELERDFNPTLRDADKINSLPALREPVVQKANTNFSSWAEPTTPPLEIALPSPAGIMTEIPFNLKKGYLSFHAGNYANLDGAFGYRLVDQPKHNLAFSFLHNSTNGEINYLQESDPAGNTAYFMDNLGKLAYRYDADAMLLDMQVSYLHSLFNYYGNTFGQDRYFDNENQRLGVFNARLGVQSKESDRLNYRGSLDFSNFSTKFGYMVNGEPVKGNQINATAGFDKPFNDINTKIGVDGSLFTTFYQGDFDNYFLINASPYIRFGGLNRSARLGADILFQDADKMRVRVAPNVELHFGLTDHTSLYATIHGGFQNNTFLEMISESRYNLPPAPVKPAFSIVDIDGGIRIGELNGFRFDIFGGFSKTDDAHFLLHHGQEVIGGDTIGNFREVLKPVYGNLSHSYIGGLIQSNIWTPLDVSLRLKKNFYDVTDMTINGEPVTDPKAYNKPGFEIDLRASLEMMQNLKFTLNYYFAGDRWSYYEDAEKEMDDINDLNLGALYEITDAFSLTLRANNILSQRYDIWYGHPAQGINISGGFTFQF
jgi:outer membrane cobalamin receptor